MLRWFISKRLDAAEKQVGAPLDYLRYMVRVHLGAFFKFTKIIPLAAYRRVLPREPYHVACLVAARHEDCGTCVQIGINLSKKDGVAAELIEAVLADNPSKLPEELADVYCFADAVVKINGEEGLYRERIRQRYGEKGLVELALAIAATRIFPTTKRALGYAVSCAAIPAKV